MDTLQGRRRRVPRGVWYFVVPVLTFGWLSAVPFIHAGLRLRDRGVVLLAGVYAVGGAVAFTLLAVAPVDAQGGTDWRADAGLGLGVVLAGSACVLLVRLRRRVFSALTGHNGALHSAPHDDRAEVTSAEDAPPVTWADLPQAPPEGSNQEAQPAGTQHAQPQDSADAPGGTPWTPPSSVGDRPRSSGRDPLVRARRVSLAVGIPVLVVVGLVLTASGDEAADLVGLASVAIPVLLLGAGIAALLGRFTRLGHAATVVAVVLASWAVAAVIVVVGFAMLAMALDLYYYG